MDVKVEPLMSARKYAAHRGCSLRAVQKALGDPDKHGIRSGRIAAALVVRQGHRHPLIDVAKANALWSANTDPAKQSLLNHSPTTAPEPPGDTEDESDLGADASDPDVARYRKERADRETINNERARLELDKLKGTLIEVAEVERLGFTVLRGVRDGLGNIGARIKNELAAMTDADAIEKKLTDEIEAVLGSLKVEHLLIEEASADDEDFD